MIELGYKSPLRGGKYRKCSDKFIEKTIGFVPKSKLLHTTLVPTFLYCRHLFTATLNG